MVVLGLCIPPMYLNIMLSQVLIAMNQQARWTWVMAGTTVVNPLFNLALIPWTQHRYGNGAIGAGISLLLTELICIAAGFVMIGRHVFDRGTLRRTVLGTCAAAAMWAVYYVSKSTIGTLPSLVAGTVTFVVLAAAVRLLTSEEVGLIRSGVDKVLRRVPGLNRFAAALATDAPPPA
jgi:O-antigen/teichoic acid export membrane protein